MCTIRRDQQRHVFTISTVIVFVFPMCVLTILYILIGLQLRRSKVMKRGTQLGSSIRLKHTIFKKSSQRTIVSINYQNDSPQHYSESMLMQHQPPLQARVSLPGSINACGNSVSNLAGSDAAGGGAAVPTNERSLLANNTHLLAEQTNSLSSEDGRINYSNRVQYHSTRHVVKMLVAVVIAFFLCWAPFHAQRLFAVYGGDQNNNEAIRKAFEIVTHISGILYFVSTCINPVLYNIMSHKFREAFKETLANYLYRRSGQPLRQRMFFRNVSQRSSSINSQSLNTCSSVCCTVTHPLHQTSAFNETTTIAAASLEACSNQNQIRYRETDLARLKRPLVVSFRKIPPMVANSSSEARQISTHGCNTHRQFFHPNEQHTTKLRTTSDADSLSCRKQCYIHKTLPNHTQTYRSKSASENDSIQSPSSWVRHGNSFRPIRFNKHRWCPIKYFTESKYSPPESMAPTIEDELCAECQLRQSQLPRRPSIYQHSPNRLYCKYDLYPDLRNVCLSSESDLAEPVPHVDDETEAAPSLKLSLQDDTTSEKLPMLSKMLDEKLIIVQLPTKSFARDEDSKRLGKARLQKHSKENYPTAVTQQCKALKSSTSKSHSLSSVYQLDNNYSWTARNAKRASLSLQKLHRRS